MLTTIDNLREIARCCQAGEVLDQDLSHWLEASLERFLRRQCQSIDEAMGLRSSRGGVPWWLEEAMRQRDAALRQLALRFYPSSSPTARAHAIRAHALRYAASAWPRDRSRDAMPPDYAGRENGWRSEGRRVG